MLHASDVSPLTYTEATLIEHGLRGDNIATPLANLIRRKFAEKKKILKNPADPKHQSHLDF